MTDPGVPNAPRSSLKDRAEPVAVDVTSAYEIALKTRAFVPDEAQRRAVELLQRMFDEWVAYKRERRNVFLKLVTRPDLPKSVYLWGGVGRGKSFLMDAFYSVVPLVRKTRVHFHEFMRSVHRELDSVKGSVDPLDEVALRIARRYRLICFDEFHVSDIADAMILHRLLVALIGHGVVFVMTSNYEPNALYPDGLHRDRILPAIELLVSDFDVLNVDGGVDYRQRALEKVQAYHTPLGAAADRALRDAFGKVAEGRDEAASMRIEHREIRALRRAAGVVWFDFATLCGGPRSQNDYLEIAARFHTVILSGVPRMSAAMQSEARRFTWLIDVLYDEGIKLIMSAEVPPDELYTEGRMANEFERTVSRIFEMQSRAYLDAPRRSVQRLATSAVSNVLPVSINGQ